MTTTPNSSWPHSTVPSEVLFGVYEAQAQASGPSLMHCGDDESSKGASAELIPDASDSIRWTLVLYGSPGTPSRSRCSSPSSHTREKEAQNWPAGSSSLRKERQDEHQKMWLTVFHQGTLYQGLTMRHFRDRERSSMHAQRR